MLRVDLREVHRGPLDTTGVLQPEDPAFEGLELGLAGPVSVEGRLQETGPGEFFWRGTVRGEVRGGCRRCLTDVAQPVEIDLNVLFSEDPDAADDPSVYPLAPAAPSLDLACDLDRLVERGPPFDQLVAAQAHTEGEPRPDGLAHGRHDLVQQARSVLTAPALWAFAAAVTLAPILWHAIKPPPAIPKPVAALYQPGKINVIEFADFECPYCRRLHAILDPLVDAAGDRVNFVRLQRPLSQHVYAEHAARAALCAEAQGKGEAMADRLFAEKLDHDKIVAIAEQRRGGKVINARLLRIDSVLLYQLTILDGGHSWREYYNAATGNPVVIP